MKSSTISFSDLNLSKQYVLEEMGYGTVTPAQTVVKILDDFFLLLEKEVMAGYAFDTYDGRMDNSTIIFGDISLDIGDTIISLLKNSVKYVLFAATAGHHFDKRMQQVKAEGDMLKTYILDAIGTCIVEKTRLYPNFVLSSGCDIPPYIQLENIETFYCTLNKFNKQSQ